MTNAITSALAQHAVDFILAVLLGILIKYAIPFIQAKTESENLATLKEHIKAAVDAAEERFVGEKLGLSVRKPWVMELLEDSGYVVDNFIDALIDSAARALEKSTLILEAAAIGTITETTEGRVTAESAVATVTAFEDAISHTTATVEAAVEDGGGL